MAAPIHQLFHEIADRASADLRRRIVATGRKDRVAFRNVAYPEVRAEFERLGGSAVPALWDGHRLLEGFEAIEEALARLPAAKGADG